MAVQTKEPLENKLQCLKMNTLTFNDPEFTWNLLLESQIKIDASLAKAERESSWFRDRYLHDNFKDRIAFVLKLFSRGYYQYSQMTAQRLFNDLKTHQDGGARQCRDETSKNLMAGALYYLLNSAFCNNDAKTVLSAYHAFDDGDLLSISLDFYPLDYTKVGFAYYLLDDFDKALGYFRVINGYKDAILEKKYNLAVAYAAKGQISDSNKTLLDIIQELRGSDELLNIPDYLKAHPEIIKSYPNLYCKWPNNLCEPDKKTAEDIYKNVLNSSNELEKRAGLYDFVFRHPFVPRPKDAEGKDWVTKPEIALARHSLLVKSEYLLAQNDERLGDPFASFHYYKVRELDPGFRTEEILEKLEPRRKTKQQLKR